MHLEEANVGAGCLETTTFDAALPSKRHAEDGVALQCKYFQIEVFLHPSF